MEKLLEMARKVADQAEVFLHESSSSNLTIQDSKPTDIKGSIQTGYALRVIKDGKMGSSYTRNLIDREELIKNALDSLIGGVKADFSFPEHQSIQSIDQFDKRTEEIGFDDMLEICKHTVDFFEGKVEGQVDCYAGTSTIWRRIMNTSGCDHEENGTEFYLIPCLIFPNTHTSIMRYFVTVGPGSLPEKDLENVLDTYTSSLPIVDMGSKKTKVMFMPMANQGFIWRLNAGLSSKNFLDKSSPLVNKVGEPIVSDKITIYNDPLDPEYPEACAFDDEGVPTRRLDVIKDGVLQACFNDLDYANKMGAEPTGTGFRTSMWGGDEVTLPLTPYLKHLRIQTGDHSFGEMLGMMDEGVMVCGEIGSHSGNILNGDFSYGLSPGLLIKDGEIVGRVRDGMVAGNVYDLLSNVLAIEDQKHLKNGVPLPCVLYEDVAVSAK